MGHEVGRQGMKDEEIIPLLHTLRPVVFFTRDFGFYRRGPPHRDYCLVYLEVDESEVASFVRRVLRHPEFDTEAKRRGKVIRASHIGLTLWEGPERKERTIDWPDR
jgi:hypothetical protein